MEYELYNRLMYFKPGQSATDFAYGPGRFDCRLGHCCSKSNEEHYYIDKYSIFRNNIQRMKL